MLILHCGITENNKKSFTAFEIYLILLTKRPGFVSVFYQRMDAAWHAGSQTERFGGIGLGRAAKIHSQRCIIGNQVFSLPHVFNVNFEHRLYKSLE